MPTSLGYLPAIRYPDNALLDLAPLGRAVDNIRGGMEQRRQATALDALLGGNSALDPYQAQIAKALRPEQGIGYAADAYERARAEKARRAEAEREGAMRLKLAAMRGRGTTADGGMTEYQKQQAELARRRLELDEKRFEATSTPAARIEKIEGRVVKIDPDGTASVMWEPPAPAPGAAPRKVAATEMRELYELDDAVTSSDEAISSLERAIEINPRARGGIGAETISSVGALLGDDTSEATLELQNVITQRVLSSLKATFGAAPTEGERLILERVAGSVGLPANVREQIFRSALAAARRRREDALRRGEAIRTGEYYAPGYATRSGTTAGVRAPAAGASVVAVAPGLEVGDVVDGYEYAGGDPADPANWREVAP